MTRLTPDRPGERGRISSVTLSLISISFSELRKDVTLLLETDWPEPVRRRAHELASALWEACSRQGLHEVALPARSIASLAALSHEKAAPLRPALREKFEELLALAQGHLARIAKRHTG
jgi:hypothetical protein